MWNTKTGEIISLFKHRTRVNHVDISLNGKLAISLDAINDRFLWDLTNKTKRTELNTNLKFLEFNNTAFTSDTNLMLSGSPNRKLQLWRTSDGELIQEWIANKNENRDRASVLAVSINSNNVSTINSDGMYEEFNITASGS